MSRDNNYMVYVCNTFIEEICYSYIIYKARTIISGCCFNIVRHSKVCCIK